MAQALLSDSFFEETAEQILAIPNFLAVATTVVTTLDTAITALDGEIGSRISLTGSRTGTEATFTGIRSGTDVIDTINGDTLISSGITQTSAGNDIVAAVIHNGITHTTNFDLEFIYTIEPQRSV